MRLFVFSLLALTIPISLHATDQRGAENTKQPVSVEIVASNAAKTSPHPIGNPDPIGNVQVTYADGTKDLWTTKGNCSLAQVGSDGTVGWTVNGSEVRINSADWMRPNGTLVLCRLGKVIAQIKSGKGFIEQWQFIENGRRLVLLTRGAHGPADIELHDVDTGKLLESVRASEENLPAWAKPYEDKQRGR